MVITKKKKTPPKKNIRKEFHHQLINVFKAFDLLECWQRLSDEEQQKFIGNIMRPMRFERDSAAGVKPQVLDAMKADIKKNIRC